MAQYEGQVHIITSFPNEEAKAKFVEYVENYIAGHGYMKWLAYGWQPETADVLGFRVDFCTGEEVREFLYDALDAEQKFSFEASVYVDDVMCGEFTIDEFYTDATIDYCA